MYRVLKNAFFVYVQYNVLEKKKIYKFRHGFLFFDQNFSDFEGKFS